MIKYTQGNLLEAPAEALVNTVNTVGVMGKGIALMFKEKFPENMKAYAKACKAKEVITGKMFVTQTGEELPRWIINFPTKQHWRAKSKMEWIEEGLIDLKQFIVDNKVNSIAIPPLGAGNGGLNWHEVKPKIESALGDIQNIEILIYEPSVSYQNKPKQSGVEKLTPARALIVEIIRRYWILGMECSLLEIQKLAWCLQRVIEKNQIQDDLKLKFEANYYGPYAHNLSHLLNALDGSYLKAEKRIPDCEPLDVIWFDDSKKTVVNNFIQKSAPHDIQVIEETSKLIDGFESPYGMELLATVDWLIARENCDPNLKSVKQGMKHWPAGELWGSRKLSLFRDDDIQLAISRLTQMRLVAA